MLRFSPRRRGSGWARTNKVRIERLLAEGLMAEPGLALIEEAKRDGSWTLLDDVENLIVPDDLAAALDAFDPDRDALVLVMPFDTTTSVAGRPAFGARRPAWVALEDKTTNDALFARADVTCAPSEVVAAADRGALDAAAA
ncbi:MAG: YdeI/OmpD-associated family protein, partial [Acidimicrobiia bacterium]